MNKLIITDNGLEKKDVSSSLSVTWQEDNIPKLKIKINQSTNLEIYIQSKLETKMELEVDVEPNIECHIEIQNTGNKSKLLTKYDIRQSSHVTITKLVDIDTTNQRDVVDLNEESATIDYILKTACTGIEKYSVTVNHNAQNTESSIVSHGINLEKGKLTFDVSTCIPKGKKGCVANQNSRIINLTNQECTIRPNLIIDEYDVIANHSAHIGSLKEEEIFYLERVGIPYEEATKLLLQGFMKSLVEEKVITNLFERYWR